MNVPRIEKETIEERLYGNAWGAFAKRIEAGPSEPGQKFENGHSAMAVTPYGQNMLVPITASPKVYASLVLGQRGVQMEIWEDLPELKSVVENIEFIPWA
jgi:hypothetical protein